LALTDDGLLMEALQAVGTIQRIFRDIDLPRLRRTPKRVPRQLKLFEKAEPGESVQVDVKFVKIAGQWPQTPLRSAPKMRDPRERLLLC
jgi:hypothetical protein